MCFYRLQAKSVKNIVFLYVFGEIKFSHLVSQGGGFGPGHKSGRAATAKMWHPEIPNVSGISAKSLYFLAF